ncbi:lysophospholipid acyltransferase [Nocardioides sp. Soil774]|uniref:lysophospholipid acyltransferase n=1 Tax=Nocardioides sp. Soil774 TaxID=1736408 RepID=UPI00138EE105|nr:lysophospholipid acyltransferase [Nocardioides sp. Soil774]
MAAVRRVRDLARAALPRSVGERLPAAPPQEVTELLHDKRFQRAVAEAAEEQRRPEEEVWEEVKGYLHEMAAAHDDRASQGWARMGEWFLRAYDVLVDEDDMQMLKKVDRDHSLALAFSHRSYLDGMVIPNALSSRRFSPTYTFGGANLNLPVIGSFASRTGLIFIRRSTQEIPVYRLALRSYIRQMVANKRNLAWSIEGGRTRTGKLRPPVHGILKYLTDTVHDGGGDDAPDVQVVPVSVVYDQLHEVSRMTEEARGASKTPEDWRWLVRFARLQRNRLGRAYLTVGEPFSLRERMDALAAEGVTGHQAVERVALDISHRINRATPVTVTAIVSLALLGADRALTMDEVLETVEPLAAYIDARHWPVAGAADLRDRSTIRRALAELARSGVLTAYDQGTEPVWKIGDDQHLVAAFYRNTVIHILVERAIGELALLTVSELEPDAELPPGGALQVGWEEAKRMRDLLKFEFFFPGRAGFEDDLRTELQLLVGGEGVTDMTPERARELLVSARPHLAHLVLRPFLDAYLVLADRLADHGDSTVDEDALLADALAVGRQWALQRRVASVESISLELFRTAMALARHKGLLEGSDGVGSAREAFAAELRDSVRRVNIIGEIAGEPVVVVQPQVDEPEGSEQAEDAEQAGDRW